jgi:hypothetical protein
LVIGSAVAILFNAKGVKKKKARAGQWHAPSTFGNSQ